MSDPRQVRDLAAAVREALAAESSSGAKPEDLTDDVEFGSERLRMDSMAFIRALISLEDLAGVEIDDDVLMETPFQRVGDVVDYILKLAGHDAVQVADE